MGRAISEISLAEDMYHSTTINSMNDLDDNTKQVPYFNHHGAVLNVEGFPGEIVFKQNTVKNIMYFIPEVFPTNRVEGVVQLEFDNFLNAETGQVSTTYCDGLDQKQRFFGDYLNSFTE